MKGKPLPRDRAESRRHARGLWWVLPLLQKTCMSKLWPVDWKQFLLSAWVLSDLTPSNPTERQGLVSILQMLGRSGSMLSVVRLGRNMARLFCATSADSMAVSLTLCCPSTRETPEVESFSLLEEMPCPPSFSAAMPSFWGNQSFPFRSAYSGRVGLNHWLPNNPGKNMVGRALSDSPSLTPLEKGGMVIGDFSLFPPAELPNSQLPFPAIFSQITRSSA